MVCKFGKVKSAYCHIAFHPCNRYLLGIKWHSRYYVGFSPPIWFEVPPPPSYINSVADLVKWILKHNFQIPDLLHYPDDYIAAGPPNYSLCEQHLSIASSVCTALGLPLHPAKKVGPTTCMVTLGNKPDSNHWALYRWCTKRQLQSLISHLQHTAKVVWHGRAFIPCMINLPRHFCQDDHPIHVSGSSTWLPGTVFTFGFTPAFLPHSIWRCPVTCLGLWSLVQS